MKGKKLIPLAALSLLALVACKQTPPTYTVNVNVLQTGLGGAVVNKIQEGNYELVVTPIDGVTVKSVTVDGVEATLTNNKTRFTCAGNGIVDINVEFNNPELSADLGVAIIENILENRTVKQFDYEHRNLILHNVTEEEMTNIYRRYSMNLYTNGSCADGVIGKSTTNGYMDEQFTFQAETTGQLLSYKYDEGHYVRAFIPETQHESGFMELLERNMFYDECSEELGYTDSLNALLGNFTGEDPNWPEMFGYNPSEFVSSVEDDVITLRIITTADYEYFEEYGYAYPAEDNFVEMKLDATTYEVISYGNQGAVLKGEAGTQAVNLTEERYSSFTYGEREEGTIPTADPTNVPEDYISFIIPEIQTNIPDGALSKENAIKILENRWAYAENTRTCTATGKSYTYDEDYNEIYGVSTNTLTAYKDYFLVEESVFTPDGSDVSTTFVTQTTPVAEGIQQISSINGVVDPESYYVSFVGPEYSFEKQFSASLLIHDFMIGSTISEGMQYGLNDFNDGSEYPYVYTMNHFEGSKNGNNITIEWQVNSYYGDPEYASDTYIKIVIENNFITSITFGDVKENADNITYHFTQGEYTQYTGEVLELPAE